MKQKNTPFSSLRRFADGRIVVIGIFLISFLIYSNTLGHNFAQDDAIVHYDNIFTQSGFSGIKDILSKDTFHGFFKEEGKSFLVSGGRYRPLSLITYALEVQLFGSQPFSGHLINAILYGLLGIVMFSLLSALFGQKNSLFSLAITLIFICHPIHTEVVANIKGRDEILCFLFGILSWKYFIKGMETKKMIHFLISSLSFGLALLSKESALPFLLLIPLSMILIKKKKVKKTVFASTGLLVILIIFLVIRSSVLGTIIGSGDSSMELMNNPFLKWTGQNYVTFSFTEKAVVILKTLLKYVELMILPLNLTHDYYPREINFESGFLGTAGLSILVNAFVLVVAVWVRKKLPVVTFGIIFYYATLFLVSNIPFPIGTNMSERFLFLPSFGFILAAVYIADHFIKNSTYKMALLILVVLLFSGKTIYRNQAWKDNFTLFTTDISKSTMSAKLNNSMAGELNRVASETVDEIEKKQILTQSIAYAENAIRIHPTYANAYLQKGNAHLYQKEFDDAMKAYQNVLYLQPGSKDANHNIFLCFREKGRFWGEQKGDLPSAIRFLTEAYKLNENDYETVRLLGVAYGISSQTENAIYYFEKGLELKPNDAQAHLNLRNAYFNAGNSVKGQFHHNRAVELDPTILKDQK